MKYLSSLKCAAIALLLLSPWVSSMASKTEVESDPRGSFSSYRNYVWHEGTRARREAGETQLRGLVDRELAAKGLVKVETDADADLRVLTYVLVDTQSLEQLADEEYWKFIKDVTAFSPYDLGAGTLVIDIVDVGRDRVVWRGVCSTEVSADSEKVMRKVSKLVAELFDKYPGN